MDFSPYVGVGEWLTACNETAVGCRDSHKNLTNQILHAAPVSTRKQYFE